MSEFKSDRVVKTPRTRIEDIPEVGKTLTAEDLQTVSGGARMAGVCQCSCVSTSCGCDCDLDQCDM